MAVLRHYGLVRVVQLLAPVLATYHIRLHFDSNHMHYFTRNPDVLS